MEARTMNFPSGPPLVCLYTSLLSPFWMTLIANSLVLVNDSINVKGWMVRQAARIRLRSLHLISFSDMYDTKSYPDWELMFMGREGMIRELLLNIARTTS